MSKKAISAYSFVFATVLSLSFGIATVFAATTTENFDSYTNGNTLDGDVGGSNWTNGWAKGAGASQIMTTDLVPTGGQGGLAAHSVASSSIANYVREFPAISSGTLQFQFYYSDATPGQEVAVFLQDSTNTGGAVN